MHILLAPDSFKESLSAVQVAEALKEGFSQALPEATFDLLPIGDGGEGTVTALISAMKLKEFRHWVTGPFGQPSFRLRNQRAGGADSSFGRKWSQEDAGRCWRLGNE